MSENYETVELPGVGEIRARPGTSTFELAGAAKFWHDKCQSARRDGFLGGVTFTTLFFIFALVGYYLFHGGL